MAENDFHLEEKLTAWHIGIALGALFLGTWFGPLQVLQHVGIDLYGKLAPGIKSYYQGLTLHGVLNALVYTTFFIVGFLTFTTVHSLNEKLRHPWLNILGFVLMAVGLVITAVPLLLNKASVLYTFYPPLQANVFFYIGLTLIVVGSWVEGFGLYYTLARWRAAHPGERTPFIAFGSVLTMVMWQIASLGLPPKCWCCSFRGLSAGCKELTRCLRERFSGSPATRSSISGCCPLTSPGTACCPNRRAERCSAIRWRGSPSGFFSCSRFPSGYITSSPIPG